MHDPREDENRGEQMQAMRGKIDQELEDLSARGRSMVDWRRYATTHPWVCLGAAAALGFLIVPRRLVAIRLDSAMLSDLARSGQLLVTPAVARRGPVRVLLATVAHLAAREAAREATAYARRRAAGFFANNQELRGKP